MKQTIVVMAALVLCLGAVAAPSHTVRGHVTKKGTYVAPSHATNPDKSRSNNYSHKGNVNPHNGKPGTKP